MEEVNRKLYKILKVYFCIMKVFFFLLFCTIFISGHKGEGLTPRIWCYYCTIFANPAPKVGLIW